MGNSKGKVIARNKKAFHNFEILEQLEAGIVLVGTEIKSIREGQVSFKDSYITFREGEAWLVGFHIAHYSHGNIWNHEEERKRKLLMSRREILKFHQKIKERGLTAVPLDLYLKRGKAKVTVGLAKGKALYDKRETLKRRDQEREMQRVKQRYT